MIAPDTPVPVSPELIEVENGWLVSDGHTLVAVYAGKAGNDPGKGRFAIVRQNLVAGSQSMDVVDVPGAGALTIGGAPTGASVETAAQTGQIGFSSSQGQTGVLDLATDTVSAK